MKVWVMLHVKLEDVACEGVADDACEGVGDVACEGVGDVACEGYVFRCGGAACGPLIWN